jgi:hypothetical protein
VVLQDIHEVVLRARLAVPCLEDVVEVRARAVADVACPAALSGSDAAWVPCAGDEPAKLHFEARRRLVPAANIHVLAAALMSVVASLSHDGQQRRVDHLEVEVRRASSDRTRCRVRRHTAVEDGARLLQTRQLLDSNTMATCVPVPTGRRKKKCSVDTTLPASQAPASIARSG